MQRLVPRLPPRPRQHLPHSPFCARAPAPTAGSLLQPAGLPAPALGSAQPCGTAVSGGEESRGSVRARCGVVPLPQPPPRSRVPVLPSPRVGRQQPQHFPAAPRAPSPRQALWQPPLAGERGSQGRQLLPAMELLPGDHPAALLGTRNKL